MSAPSVTMPEGDIRWILPARGPVGMYCLIAAEAAIFTIFVVAYIFYIGKSLTGPQPQDVLHVSILFTICLLSSSLTIHFAVRLLRGGKVRSFALWWLLTIGLDHPNQLIRDYLLLIGWSACVSRNRRPACSCDGVAFHASWACTTGARRTRRGFVDVLALRRYGVGGGLHRRIYCRPLRKGKTWLSN